MDIQQGGSPLRLVVQRVKQASVQIQHETVGEIGPGLLVFLGVGQDDTEEDVGYLVKKVLHLGR
jgi:D-tyrosyl-tRNA(Tyr) deacylase